MKKIVVCFVALMAFIACSEQKPFAYRGLSFSMPASQLVDSLLARGFLIDSATSDSGRQYQLYKAGVPYRVLVAYENDQLRAIQENYHLSTNDSTRRTWQQLRDDFEKQLGSWPNMPKHGDDHKIAKFESDGGFITLTLENTYRPTLTVLYELK